jgi:hypothetical protein
MFGLHMVSQDDALPSDRPGYSSAVAVAFVLKDASGGYPKLLDLMVVGLGTNRIDEEAEKLLGDLDKNVGDFRRFCK